MDELDRMAADAKTALSGTIPPAATIRAGGDRRRARRRRRNRIGLLAAAAILAAGATAGAVSLWPQQPADVIVQEAADSPGPSGLDAPIELIAVPDVIGLEVDEAIAILEALGLRGEVGADGGLPPAQGWGRIISTDPPAGAEVDPAIVVLIGVGPPPSSSGAYLEEPIFSGDTWALTVGEEANGDTGSYKVCHMFVARDEAGPPATGLGPSGCGDWPSTTQPDAVIIDAVPALRIDDTTILFIDLGTVPVEVVVALDTDGTLAEVTPFAMPQSGKQFAVIEVPTRTAAVTLQAMGPDGTLLGTLDITDLHDEE